MTIPLGPWIRMYIQCDLKWTRTNQLTILCRNAAPLRYVTEIMNMMGTIGQYTIIWMGIVKKRKINKRTSSIPWNATPKCICKTGAIWMTHMKPLNTRRPLTTCNMDSYIVISRTISGRNCLPDAVPSMKDCANTHYSPSTVITNN